MLESAAFVERIRHAKEYGVDVGEPGIDYAGIAARRDATVKRLWTGLKSLVDKNKVTWVQGQGKLDGPTHVRVKMEPDADNPGGERVLQGTDVILATGSRVKSLPGLTPDGKKIITSDDVLTGAPLPKDIIVVGAGAVGVEFASMYHDLGVKTTLLEYLPSLVPLEDREVSQALERSFTRRGMTVMTNARFDPAKVKATKSGVSLDVGPEGKEASNLTAEMLLVATGRAPNIEDVGLETTKAEVDKGFVKVDLRTMRTREPHLYAIGDVVGGLMLAHTAGHEGILAAHTIAGDKDTHPMDYVEQPRATYCRPEIASVGLDRAAVPGAGPAVQGRQGPVPGDRQGAHRRRVRGLRQGHRQHRDRRHARRPHHRAARDGPDRRGLAGVHARGDALGDRRHDARPPDARARSSARRPSPSTAARSTSDGDGTARRPQPTKCEGRQPRIDATASRSSPHPSG